MARNRVIGRDGRLPWHFPADLKHFKKATTNQLVVMGRWTFEQVGPLPNRDVVVLSRDAHSVEDVLSLAESRDVFIAGGGQVYNVFVPMADKMMLTYIHQDVEGDTFFPYFEADEWDATTARRGNRHSYLELMRR